MSIQNRLNKLEGAARDDGRTYCRCLKGSLEVRYYPGETSERDAEGDTRPGEACEVCGLPKRLIKVVYVAEWRGGGLSIKEEGSAVKNYAGIAWEDV